MFRSYINEEVYFPILKDFFLNTQNLFFKLYKWGPLIPSVYSDYKNSKTHYFYLDLNPNIYVECTILPEEINNKNIKEYIKRMCETICLDPLTKNKVFHEYYFERILKLHLLLTTGILYKEVPASLYKHLNEIGYGSTAPINLQCLGEYISELDRYFDGREILKLLDILSEAYRFSTVKDIIRAYKPDIIIIFSPDRFEDDIYYEDAFDKKIVLSDLELQQDKSYFNNKDYEVYQLKNSVTKIIWCYADPIYKNYYKQEDILRQIEYIVKNKREPR